MIDFLSGRRVSIFLCILWVLIITWLSLTPSPPKVTNSVLGWDKFQHACAYAALTFLAIRAFSTSRSSVVTVFLCVVMFGALLEVAQGFFTCNRFADLLDSLANTVGALIVSLIYFFLTKRNPPTGSGTSAIVLILSAAALFAPLESDAADHIFNSAAEFRSATERLADEGGEVARFPLGLDNYGLYATALVAGSVAVTTQFDEDIRDDLASNRSATLDHLADAGSLLGNPFLHLGIAAGVYGAGVLGDSPHNRELGEMFGEAAILADATTLIIKQSIGRGRPSATSDSGRFRPFQFSMDYDSLPSMHTSSSFAMASVMASHADSSVTGLAAYTAAAFVGFSRMYEEKHWASDVLLGAAVGELCGRVVTRYHTNAKTGRITVAPIVARSSALFSFVGRF